MFYGLKQLKRSGKSAGKALELCPRLFAKTVSLFKNGCEDAYAGLYHRFRKPIFQYVKSRIADDAVAEELTQEIFIKVYRFRETYEDKYAFSTWLWTIARNTISDHLRGTRGAACELDEEEIFLDDLPSPLLDAEAIAIARDKRRSLMKMVRSLTRLQKRVLWMRVMHQLSYDEIAAKLGLSLSAVKNLVYRAKIALSEDLGPVVQMVSV